MRLVALVLLFVALSARVASAQTPELTPTPVLVATTPVPTPAASAAASAPAAPDFSADMRDLAYIQTVLIVFFGSASLGLLSLGVLRVRS